MELAGLHPELEYYAQLLVNELRRVGLRVVITSVRRSRAAQARLYAEYLAGRNPYPVAKPGTSDHETGLAWDMDVRWPDSRDAAPVAGQLWNQMGGRWSSRDRVHFTV